MTLYTLSEIPEISKKEILRYARAKNDGQYDELVDECIKECEGELSYRLCYKVLLLEINGDAVKIGNMIFTSSDLSKCLKGSRNVVAFSATLGVGLDRLIHKYSKILPSKALFFQAIGSERIEALCDTFCRDFGKALTPRFSAGYGDLPLDAQREIFSSLDITKTIGVTLTDSLMMSPTKSVTAFAGVKE